MNRFWFWLPVILVSSWLGNQHAVIHQTSEEPPEPALIRRETIEFSPWELVTALSWSPEANFLAVSAGDIIYLFETTNWGRVASLYVGALTHGLSFSPDGSWLAAGSRDGRLRIWQTSQLPGSTQAGPALILQAHRKGVNRLRFSHDGRILASGGNDAIARFWDPANGELLGMTIGGSFAVPSIAFTPDDELLAVVNGNVVRLRQVGSERIVGTFQAESPLFHVVLSPDGSLLAAAGSDNLIRIWQVDQAYRTGQTVYPIPLLLNGHDGTPGSYRALVWETAFTPDGKRLLSVGGDGTLRLWDPLTGAQLEAHRAHARGASSLAVHPDGSAVATGGLDGRLVIWDFNP
jgi:WD40 repeat protein